MMDIGEDAGACARGKRTARPLWFRGAAVDGSLCLQCRARRGPGARMIGWRRSRGCIRCTRTLQVRHIWLWLLGDAAPAQALPRGLLAGPAGLSASGGGLLPHKCKAALLLTSCQHAHSCLRLGLGVQTVPMTMQGSAGGRWVRCWSGRRRLCRPGHGQPRPCSCSAPPACASCWRRSRASYCGPPGTP